jgi:hypothetical protein
MIGCWTSSAIPSGTSLGIISQHARQHSPLDPSSSSLPIRGKWNAACRGPDDWPEKRSEIVENIGKVFLSSRYTRPANERRHCCCFPGRPAKSSDRAIASTTSVDCDARTSDQLPNEAFLHRNRIGESSQMSKKSFMQVLSSPRFVIASNFSAIVVSRL